LQQLIFYFATKNLLLEYLLFVTYLIIFSWFATRARFFNQSGLNKDQLVILFLVKVMTGIFYGWVGIYYGGYAEMVDTWAYHHQSLDELKLLTDHPQEYFTNLFHTSESTNRIDVFLGSDNSYWNDLRMQVLIKMLSIFDIFSLGNYYVNVIFYSYITMFGPIALYRVFSQVFPEKKLLVLAGICLVPSFLYWASGIHKEGLVFLSISLIIYHTYYGLEQNRWPLKRWLGIFLALFICLLVRNYLLILIPPALVAWFIAHRFPKRKLTCFLIVYGIGSVLFFCLSYIHPRLDFPQSVVDKQQAFLQLKGTSSIPIRELKPTLMSFIINTPQAITLSAFRPYPSDIRHFFSMAAAIETLLLLVLFIVSIVWHDPKVTRDKNVVYFCLFFSVSLLLTIGFSVNNLGAIVRYRSVVIPLLIPIALACTDWKRVPFPSLSNIKKINNQNKS
jgi:hypothetical protein